MSYESWRASFQSSEQAAKAAYEAYKQLVAYTMVKDRALEAVISVDKYCSEPTVNADHRQAKADAHHEALLKAEKALSLTTSQVQLVKIGTVAHQSTYLDEVLFSSDHDISKAEVGETLYTIRVSK